MALLKADIDSEAEAAARVAAENCYKNDDVISLNENKMN